MRSRLTLLVLLLFAHSAPAAVLVRIWPGNLVAITKDPLPAGKKWFLNDYVCLKRGTEVAACGQVVRITEKGLILNITGTVSALRLGNRLAVQKVDYNRYYASGVVDLEYLEPTSPYTQRSAAGGMNNGDFYAHLEVNINRHFTFGFMATPLNLQAGISRFTGFGYFGTLTLYTTRPYQGFYFRTAFGMYFYKSNVGRFVERSSAITVSNTFGYKIPLFWRVTLGVGAGYQYMVNHNSTRIDLKFNGLIPATNLELGIRF